MSDTSSQGAVRSFPERPNIEQLKKQARELLAAFRDGEAGALAEVGAHDADAVPATFRLADAQRVLARAYSLDSWPKLVARVRLAETARFFAAAEQGDVAAVTVMVGRRADLATMQRADNDERTALHLAVLNRDIECSRVLLEAGADPERGVFPHREATSALAIAEDRGYEDIVDLIRAAASDRAQAAGAVTVEDHPLRTAALDDDIVAVREILDAEPELVGAQDEEGRAALHHAAARTNVALTRLLVDLDPDLARKDRSGLTALDCAALSFGWADRQRATQAEEVARILVDGGAPITPRGAVVLGDIVYLQAANLDELRSCATEGGGLLTLAVRFGRSEVLAALLAKGLHPDERYESSNLPEPVISWGMPLWHASAYSEYDMAETLLDAGADPNGMVYASGPSMERAYGADDERMKRLLSERGVVPTVETIGLFRDVAAARQVLDRTSPGVTDRTDTTTIEQLLWAAARGGEPEIIAICLPRIDRALDDPWWSNILRQPLRIWNHGPMDSPPASRAPPTRAAWSSSSPTACTRTWSTTTDSPLSSTLLRPGPRGTSR